MKKKPETVFGWVWFYTLVVLKNYGKSKVKEQQSYIPTSTLD